ncbi:MAG: hypothetical protein ACI9K1_000960, partial [Arcticibacterium sp.]
KKRSYFSILRVSVQILFEFLNRWYISSIDIFLIRQTLTTVKASNAQSSFKISNLKFQ